ncbi:KN motif and ankyrin repeat domain-containing protein 4 [Bombina bombina]|uniref:KN motif and ankyrin repeat domain-containing protein 4 n=1 Tax=Bombina bombina TaxID=8345 RepID=UPI00235B164D|nr:KN motif and ankyrin repeat domain-containing protein 4 [Bombina bombina]XP_053549625.1 KN motif and ankyrin repeat domain-containing protein 4 [Bombina bombina]
MDKTNVGKTNGEGTVAKKESKEKHMSYSVETPYGFHLDLDFLKYVHDIEKGNTIKRIHIHRRAKQSKFSTLPRNFSVPGNGSQSYSSSSRKTWDSACARADAKDSSVFASNESLRLRYVHELNYRRKDSALDLHRPTGDLYPEDFSNCRDRPNFVRASSMPAALPQSTMLSDLPQSINSFSESRLTYFEEPLRSQKNISEDHITESLKRIKELEDQLRIIPELRETISILKEENKQLTVQLKSISKLLKDKKEQQNVEFKTIENENTTDAATSENGERSHLSAGELDQSLFLDIKQNVTDLTAQLYDSTNELHNFKALVETQTSEIQEKDIHIAELTSLTSRMEEVISRRHREKREYKDIAVNTDPIKDLKETCDKSTYTITSVEFKSVGCGNDLVDLGEHRLLESGQTSHLIVAESTLDVHSGQQFSPGELTCEEAIKISSNVRHVGDGCMETVGSQEMAIENKACIYEEEEEKTKDCSDVQTPPDASVGQYVKRIQDLLQEQWTYLEKGYPDLACAIKQPASKLSSIQTQLVNSLNLLSSVYSTSTGSDKENSKTGSQEREATPRTSLKSIMKKKNSNCRSGGNEARAKKNLQFVGVNGGYETTSSEDSSSSEEYEDNDTEKANTETDLCEYAAIKGQTDHLLNLEPEENEQEPPDIALSATSDTQKALQRSIMGDSIRRDCEILSSHLAELRTTSDNQLRQTFYTVCQEWFRVSSQNSSRPDNVAVYLEEFRSISPQLLQMIVNISDENGNTALHYSVSHSNFGIIKLLLETGVCDVDHQNKAGYTPVMLTPLAAAETDEDMNVVHELLNRGNINLCSTQEGQTALMLGVSHGRSDMVKVLLSCGCDINVQDEYGNTALMIACQLESTEIIKLLLAQPECDTELTDKAGNSALSIVTHSAHSEIAELLQTHTEQRRSSASTETGRGASL